MINLGYSIFVGFPRWKTAGIGIFNSNYNTKFADKMEIFGTFFCKKAMNINKKESEDYCQKNS